MLRVRGGFKGYVIIGFLYLHSKELLCAATRRPEEPRGVALVNEDQSVVFLSQRLQETVSLKITFDN